MIAQTLAARYPERIRTLTSIFSTTGSLRVGQPAYKTILHLVRRPPESAGKCSELSGHNEAYWFNARVERESAA